MMELMDKLGMRGTVCLNAEIITEYPRIIEESLARDWAFIGHGINNAPANFIGNAPDGEGGHTPLPEEKERERKLAEMEKESIRAMQQAFSGSGGAEVTIWERLRKLEARGVEVQSTVDMFDIDPDGALVALKEAEK